MKDKTLHIILYLRKLLSIYTVCLTFMSLVCTKADGQVAANLEIYYQDQNESQFFRQVDSTKINIIVADQLKKEMASGYILIHLDSLVCNKEKCKAFVYKGDKHTIHQIKFNEELKAILEESGIKLNRVIGKPLDSILIFRFLKTLVSHQNNIGYPFATARFDSLTFDKNLLSVGLKISKGKRINFDTIIQEGRLVMYHSFLSRLLDINRGDYYSQEKIVRANARLRDLPYSSTRIAPFVRFVNDKASLVITLDPKPASRFDFLIGVLPQIKDGVRKFVISGDFTAELNNTFKQGEYSFFQFKRLQPENLELLLKSTIPYVGGLPVGSHFDFRLFKNGLQNLDLFLDGGVQYQFGGFNQMKLFGSYRSSSLLDINVAQIQSAGRLPDILDLTYTGGGLGLNLRKLDYRFNPSKGYTVDINTVVGSKKIIPNRQIVDIEGFENSYDTLKSSTLQLELDVAGAYYFPIKKWAALKLGANAGLRYNEQNILDNEKIRIGGSKLLRGFDEETILTDFYAFGNVEFRILFDQNSFLSLPFIDYGVTRIELDGVPTLDKVIGIGMGLNFGTNAGIFNISFAAGSNLGNPLDFGKMKIHFGYVNLF